MTKVLQVVGYKNTGKTTLVCHIIKAFAEQGWKVGSIKHDAHEFEVDHEGKDTWKHREAGASVVAITSKSKTAIMENRPTSLEQLIERMHGLDLIIVEGYKSENYPKLVLVKDEPSSIITEEASNILAICSWIPLQHETLPVIDINDLESIIQLIKNQYDLREKC